jgi:hypothetical protein
MIRKLSSGKYRLCSRKKDPKTGRRRNLGTFGSRAAAERHEHAVQYFKRHCRLVAARRAPELEPRLCGMRGDGPLAPPDGKMRMPRFKNVTGPNQSGRISPKLSPASFTILLGEVRTLLI